MINISMHIYIRVPCEKRYLIDGQHIRPVSTSKHHKACIHYRIKNKYTHFYVNQV